MVAFFDDHGQLPNVGRRRGCGEVAVLKDLLFFKWGVLSVCGDLYEEKEKI